MTHTTTTFQSGLEKFLGSLYTDRKTEVTNRVRTRLALPDLRERTEDEIRNYGAHGNILRVAHGESITTARFTRWLSTFMVFGSDTKLAICDLSAWTAMSLFMKSGMGGFHRIADNEPDPTTGIVTTTFCTPYGRIDLASVKDEDPERPQGRAVVVDIATFIYGDDPKKSAANGIAYGILKIVA